MLDKKIPHGNFQETGWDVRGAVTVTMRSVFLTFSYLVIMATVAFGGSAGRSIDQILTECAEAEEEFKSLDASNDFRNVFNHSQRCKIGKECRCCIYRFLEVATVKQTLLQDSTSVPTTGAQARLEIKDSDSVVGLDNVCDVFRLGSTTPNTNVVALN